jgi:hypothetical protein
MTPAVLLVAQLITLPIRTEEVWTAPHLTPTTVYVCVTEARRVDTRFTGDLRSATLGASFGTGRAHFEFARCMASQGQPIRRESVR